MNGHPVRFDDAFQSMNWQPVLSQAASLLLLGQGLRGGLSFSAEPGDGIILEEDLDALNLPRLPYFLRRIDREQVLQSLEDGYGRAFVEQMQSAPFLDAQSVLPVASEIAHHLSRSPEPLLAAQLMEVNLFHPEPLVRAAAAISYFDLSSQPRRPFEVLLDATYSDHGLTRRVALAGLERLVPGHPRLLDADTEGVFSEEGLASTTCILMHGSWSRGAPWWQPGRNFHDYFCRDVRSDLYDAEDRFSWSGGLGDGYRVFVLQSQR
ncbi:MAG: hypothetical protein H7Y22_01160 [Gemmatimonadaceae bacterium]|nr:hypothetical protein [Gloeobacterales cyanobacterium ES-bin-141]